MSDWEPTNNSTRNLIRTAGWREVTDAGVLKKEYVGIITLGTFEDEVNDLAYYQVGNDPDDTTAAINFVYNGAVNEGIRVYEEIVPANSSLAIVGALDANTVTRATGSWITDGFKIRAQATLLGAEDAGNNVTRNISAVSATVLTLAGAALTTNADDDTMRVAYNYRTALKLFLRVRDGDTNGKTYAQSSLSDIGVTTLRYQAYRFPLSNAADLKITETDANIAANSPYTQINLKYFDQAFTRDVDSATDRNFGIVVDVGTHSGVDGSTTATGNTLTTTEAGITGANYTGGTLTIHEGTNAGVYTISGTPTASVVTITGTFANTVANQSFTLQRATPISATAEQIYEKVQYLLRQAADIDTTDQIVTGKTASSLLTFVGDTLVAGVSIPTNPNGGGTGVIIEGFSANDTNRLTFYDNTGVARTYPFVAAGSITFNSNLVTDGDGAYWMFYEYTERFTNTGFAISGVSGQTATLTSSTTNLVTELSNGDYIKLDGFANTTNNGIWVLTGAPAGAGPYTAAVTRVDDKVPVNETAGATVSMDKNPINSPDTIIVQNASDTNIAGTITVGSVSFDYDYDGNVQGGRTAGTDAAIVLRAIGLDTAQFVETTGTITRAVGLSFSMTASLERNYENP